MPIARLAAAVAATLACAACSTSSSPVEPLPDAAAPDAAPVAPDAPPGVCQNADDSPQVDAGGIGQACCTSNACLGSAACASDSCVASVTCTGAPGCSPIAIAGDPPSTVANNYLVGYADPSIRRSLDRTTVYMGYSWPTMLPTTPPTRTLETHLAASTDNGATLTFVGPLFTSPGAENIPGSTTQGVRSSEEISLVSAALDPAHPTVPYWVSVREQYYRDVGSPDLIYGTYHLRIGMTQGASPIGLANGDATEQVILNKDDTAAFRAAMPANHVELTTLLAGSSQTDCDYPVSPALYYDQTAGYLYLTFQCYVGGSIATSVADSALVVFRTSPYADGAVLPPTSWQWSYRGSFGGAAQAALMQTNGIPATVPNMMFMPDFAVAADGTLLLVATPVTYDANGSGRTGCQVYEMASIDPPALAMRDGQLVRRAVVNDPNLSPDNFNLNSGSCGYEPSATALGLLFATKSQAPSQVVSSVLNNTQVHD